jgi:hypothetical protein
VIEGFFFSSTSQSLPDQAAISKASYSYLFTTLRYVGTALILWILLNILDQPLQNLQLVCGRLSAPTSDNSFSFFCQYLKEIIEHMFNNFHGVRHTLLYYISTLSNRTSLLLQLSLEASLSKPNYKIILIKPLI